MRRAAASGLIGLAILLCTPRPASAQWSIIKWLEELSGPGYIAMWSFESHLGCIKNRPATQPERDAIDAALKTGPRLWRAITCDQNPIPIKGSSQPAWKEVRAFFTLAYGQSFFEKDPLTYAGGVNDLSLKTFTGGVAVRLRDWLDLGMSVGTARFSGSASTTFYKPLLNPYLVARPLARANPKIQRLVFIKLDFVVFPTGFTDAEFGATSTRLNGKAELIIPLVIGVDLSRFLAWN